MINLSRTGKWQELAPTKAQMEYISTLKRNNPALPPFTGTTRGEAAVYIERHKGSVNHETFYQKKGDEENGKH